MSAGLAFARRARREVEERTNIIAPRIVTLLGGHSDETFTVSNCTASADTVNKVFGAQSHKFTMSGAVTATARLQPLPQGDVSVRASEFGALVYLEDVTRVTALTFQVYTDAGQVNYWNFNTANLPGGVAGNLATGWNTLRFVSSRRGTSGSPATWGTCAGVRVTVVTNDATTVSVQRLWFQERPKASILFIHDGGYNSGWDTRPGYYDLRDRGVPVTWSCDVGLMGPGTDRVTEERLQELASENGNSIGLHGYDATVTSALTGAQLQAQTMKAIKWLAARGHTGRIWRSAWFQNAATNSSATDSLVLANPMGGGDSVERVNTFPFEDTFNVVRVALHGKSDAEVDTLFAELEANHGVLVCYTHRVSESGVTNITPAAWAYFLSKIDEGIAGGWLEGVTFEELFRRMGGTLRTGLHGGITAEWPDFDGTLVSKQLP